MAGDYHLLPTQASRKLGHGIIELTKNNGGRFDTIKKGSSTAEKTR